MPNFKPANKLLIEHSKEFFLYLQQNKLDEIQSLLTLLLGQDKHLSEDVDYIYLQLLYELQHDNLFKSESNIIKLERNIDDRLQEYKYEEKLYLFYFVKAKLYLSTMRIKEAIEPLQKYADLTKDKEDFYEAQRLLADCYGYLGMKEKHSEHLKLADEKSQTLEKLLAKYRELELDPLKKMELAEVALKISEIDPTSRKAYNLLSQESMAEDRYHLRLSGLNNEAKMLTKIILEIEAKINAIKSIETPSKNQKYKLQQLENELQSKRNFIAINHETSEEVIKEMGPTEDVVQFLAPYFKPGDND